MTPQEKQAVDESIAHHKRMSAWVRTQDETDKASLEVMGYELKEDWTAEYCALCKLYEECDECVLAKKYGDCTYSDTNAWNKLYKAKTWQEWLIHDEEMIKQLESLE